jgi:hypothetical protein
MSDVFKKAPDNLKKAFISESSGNVITCMGRMMYAAIVTPGFPSKTERRPEKKQWQIQLLIPDGADIKALQDRVAAVADDNLTKAQKANKAAWKNPIKNTAQQATFASFADDYPIVISANAKCFQKDGKPRPAPDVVLSSGKAMPAADEAEECYNGRWCRISLQPYWYDNENIGVSLGLSNVQLLSHDDPLAGGKVSADRDFEPVGDGLDDLEAGADFE